jgi:hypothetical protein
MNNFEAEQLFHRVARFPAPRRNSSTREPATITWRPRYVETPPLLDQAALRSGAGWGRASVVQIGRRGLRKVFL